MEYNRVNQTGFSGLEFISKNQKRDNVLLNKYIGSTFILKT